MKEENIAKKLMKIINEKFNKGYERDSPIIDDIQISGDGTSTDIYIDFYNRHPLYDYDLELKIMDGRVYAETRNRINACSECGHYDIKRDWIEIEDFDTLDDIVSIVYSKDD